VEPFLQNITCHAHNQCYVRTGFDPQPEVGIVYQLDPARIDYDQFGPALDSLFNGESDDGMGRSGIAAD
jgi:hypothetical protein